MNFSSDAREKKHCELYEQHLENVTKIQKLEGKRKGALYEADFSESRRQQMRDGASLHRRRSKTQPKGLEGGKAVGLLARA